MQVGEIHIMEGNGNLVSSLDGEYGLVLSELRNDLAAITEEYTRSIRDFQGSLIVFTHFKDRASPAPAYFVPIYNETIGTGMGAIDRRSIFGVSQLDGFINMQSLESHGDGLIKILLHEVAHRHLAYMKVQTQTSTKTIDLTGREGGHWHAAFNSQGSILEGYGWRESGPGRFVSVSKQDRFAPIDLYALGLESAEELGNLFFIRDARVVSGARLPAAADLPIGTVVTGTRADFTGLDLVRTMGQRPPNNEMQVAFLLLTAPGETTTSSSVIATAERLEEVRQELEEAWRSSSNGKGKLITTAIKANAVDASTGHGGSPPNATECQCESTRSLGTQGIFSPIILASLFCLRRRRTT